ncbi:MAG: transglycosylase domain-containing protein, partial [Nitrospinota bacterium]
MKKRTLLCNIKGWLKRVVHFKTKMSRPQKKRKKVVQSAGWKRLFFRLSAFFILIFGVWVFTLDFTIKRKFEGRRWDLPAHVYSAPDILFSGARISIYQLEQQLRNLGYFPSLTVQNPGEFKKEENSLVFFSRDFHFFDGVRHGKPVKITFSGNSVEEITDGNTGQPINTHRIEPLLIGGIYPDSREDRLLVRLSDVPPIILKALIASEDRDFFTHQGVSLKALARAFWVNLSSGGARLQGGSTLTQQLVKNYFLSAERTLWRKIKEACMSLLLEFHYSKNEILEAYLNEVYLGQDGKRSINGFGLASFFYFSRPASELTLSQAATLVALVRGPSVYNPFRFPQKAKKRRNLILRHLMERGNITPKTFAREKAAPLSLNRRGKHHENLYPAFLALVKQQLKRDYRSEDLKTEGLRIFTTLNPRIQTITEIKINHNLERMENLEPLEHGELQAAAIITNPDNGEISAMIGDRHLRKEGFNRALNAYRP